MACLLEVRLEVAERLPAENPRTDALTGFLAAAAGDGDYGAESPADEGRTLYLRCPLFDGEASQCDRSGGAIHPHHPAAARRLDEP